MSDINLAPTTTDTISNEIPIPIDAIPDSSSNPEHVSETLYIQNLNEKIRIDGLSPLIVIVHADYLSQSSRHLCAVSSSRTVRYLMLSRTTTFVCVVKHLSPLRLRTLPKKP
jgi:hypothetical protein